jgi:hypothetical protein
MKKLLLSLVLMIGCVGADTPRNPMKRDKPEVEAWWRATTYGVKKEDNPWEKFVHPYNPVNRFDPWANDDLSRYSVSPITTQSVSATESSVTAPRIYFLRMRAKKQIADRRKIERESGDNLRDWLEHTFDGERLKKELELLRRRKVY